MAAPADAGGAAAAATAAAILHAPRYGRTEHWSPRDTSVEP